LKKRDSYGGGHWCGGVAGVNVGKRLQIIKGRKIIKMKKATTTRRKGKRVSIGGVKNWRGARETQKTTPFRRTT